MRSYGVDARAVCFLFMLSFVVIHFQHLILFESEQETLKQRRYSLVKLQIQKRRDDFETKKERERNRKCIQILIVKLEEKRRLGRIRLRLVNHIKEDVKKSILGRGLKKVS